jgi:hypothetical protein
MAALKESDPNVLEEKIHRLPLARWTSSSALSMVLACAIAKTLHDRSLDESKTPPTNFSLYKASTQSHRGHCSHVPAD